MKVTSYFVVIATALHLESPPHLRFYYILFRVTPANACLLSPILCGHFNLDMLSCHWNKYSRGFSLSQHQYHYSFPFYTFMKACVALQFKLSRNQLNQSLDLCSPSFLGVAFPNPNALFYGESLHSALVTISWTILH